MHLDEHNKAFSLLEGLKIRNHKKKTKQKQFMIDRKKNVLFRKEGTNDILVYNGIYLYIRDNR